MARGQGCTAEQTAAPRGGSGAATVTLQTTRGPVEVNPARIDEAAVQAYRNGQCVALALALHEARDWPVYCLLARPGDLAWEERMNADGLDPAAEPNWFYDFAHALFQTDGGSLVDIDTYCGFEDYLDGAAYDYGCAALVEIYPQALRAAYEQARADGHTAPALDHELAARFAATLLAELGL